MTKENQSGKICGPIGWLLAALRTLAVLWAAAAALFLALPAVQADLRATPVWYDQNAVGLAPDWHYRIPITIPAGATVNSTIVANVDFPSQLAAMGVSGTFDVNSPRVVRSTGALSTNQQFTDTVFSGATDAAGNGRGEIRFILQEPGAVTYWLYFDITQNGAKAANPQVPINGNFEFGTAGTATPVGWATSTKVNAAFDTQIVTGGTVNVLTDSATLNNPFNTNGDPNTGLQSYLIGARTNNEPTSNANATRLDRTIVVPATSPGNLVVRWKPQGWDSNVNGGANGFDQIRVTVVGGATTQVIGPVAGNYATRPFAPSYGTAAITAAAPGYGAYNSWDMGTSGTPRTQGMTVPYNADPWWTHSFSLAPFAGQTVTLRIETGHITQFKSWALIDDIEWSVVNATLGTPQAFGTNITAPAAASNFVPGQVIAVTAQVDAVPSAGTAPMTVALFDSGGTQIGGPFLLYNDGTRGDATAGDAIWSNNGSVLADAVIVPLSATVGSGYILRAFAKDGSTSTIGAQAGLIRGPGSGAAAATQANYWNIDEILFNVQTALLTITKTSTPIDDPVNGTTNPKLIPGATARYCVLIQNAGALAATNLVIADPLPANVTFVPGTIRSGTSCVGAGTAEPNSLIAGTTLTRNLASLAAGASFAITLDVTVN